ncbi:MAG: hypothetical protein AAFW01_13080 [Pseudomonadota bacterium]
MSYYDEAVLMTYQLERWGNGAPDPSCTPRALGLRRRPRVPVRRPLPWAFIRLVP